jgi:predicted SprT family Zn-dependent metalloprotease
MVIFLVDWLFAIPILTLQIAKTGKYYRDRITSIRLNRQDCQVDHKSFFNTLPVHELCLEFPWTVKKSIPEPTKFS